MLRGEKGKKGKEITLYDENKQEVRKGTYPEYIYAQLLKTVQELESNGKRVYVMSNIPEVDFNVPSILAKAEYLKLRFNYHNSIDIRQTVSGHNEYQKNVSDILQRLEKRNGCDNP